jgi:glycosyltransferase involved in cell wall biosynthesis
MSEGSPLVSVCVPTYNGARHVVEAVASVLAQTHEHLELLVRDDGSDDETVELVRSFDDPRIIVARNERNLGPGRNWNRMLGDVRGRYVKVMGQDDVLYPGCLAEQVAALETLPDAAFTACRRDVVDPDGDVLFRDRGLPRMEGRLDIEALLPRIVASGGNPVGEPVTVLARRSALERVGGFAPDKAYVIDLDCWTRLLEVGPLVAVPRTLCAFRVAAGSWSIDLASQQAQQVGALQQELRARHPGAISGAVYARGRVLAVGLSLARRVVYLDLARRARRRARRDPNPRGA